MKVTKDDPFFKAFTLSPFRYSKARHIRIADILAADEDQIDGYDCVADFNMVDDGIGRHIPNDNYQQEGFMALQCSSPRRIISRWLSALKRSKRRRRNGVRSGKGVKEAGISGDESTHATSSTNGLAGAEDKESGQLVKDSSTFNLGIACGLIYLIVASKNELAKMADLRAELEILLQNAKGELQGKSNAPFDAKPFESNEMNLASSTTDFHRASSSSSSDSRFSLQSHVVRDVCSGYVRNGEEGEVDMGRLEAELQAELERLQLHLDSETCSSNSPYPQQQRLKAVRDAACAKGDDDISSFGESADQNEIPCDCGVPALELERRLHELLEARQEERIKELEVSLEYAKRKLHEKEIEVSWWKETATTAALVSHHVPEPPSPSVASQRDCESSFQLLR